LENVIICDIILKEIIRITKGSQRKVNHMMYPYMTLNDNTEITHSQMYEDGRVKVYIETPDYKDGFHDATCWLPDYEWECHGYTHEEMEYFKKLIRDNAHLIIEFSQEGGILNASVV
jgi:hypothetical protein